MAPAVHTQLQRLPESLRELRPGPYRRKVIEAEEEIEARQTDLALVGNLQDVADLAPARESRCCRNRLSRLS